MSGSPYELRFGVEAMDLDRVHGWLTTAYWSPAVTRELVVRAANGASLVVGAFLGDDQTGYMRVVSDRATFAWICDVFVDPDHRGKGIASMMIQAALDDPGHQGLRRWVLATADAHAVYAKLGFEPLPFPDRWMIIRAPHAQPVDI